MAPSSLNRRRTHNLLLISKLLDQVDGASPFTLVLDDLEQSGAPLVNEYVKRANSAGALVVLVSFATLQKAVNADVLFVEAWSQTLQAWQSELTKHVKTNHERRKLIIFDSLNGLGASESATFSGFLGSIMSPNTTLLAVYHTDVPLPSTVSSNEDSYCPSPLTLLNYVATTIFRMHSPHHVMAKRAARYRSLAEPCFGLMENRDGILQGLGSNAADAVVLEMEHRRKSGRGVRDWFVLSLQHQRTSEASASTKAQSPVTLLEDHPTYGWQSEKHDSVSEAEDSEIAQSTFELGLTERQRLDRDGVVLPYFDAQKGGGDGGRILYEMDREDDFDDEEDEI